MNMRILKSANGNRQSAIKILLILILLILLTMLVVKIIRVRSTALPPPPIASPTPEPLTSGGGGGGGPDLSQLLTHPDQLAASLPAGAAPLDHEPADLPVPPHSEILLRFQTNISGGTSTSGGGGGGDHEETCVRSIPDTSLESAASFYRQALSAGGEKFTGQTPAPLVIRLTCQRPDGSLMIRLRQAGPEVRAVIQLRYTMNQEKNSPRSSPRTQREK